MTGVATPDMSSRELAEQFRVTCPDVRVLYMLGYTDDEIVRRGLLDPGVAFLEKPFTAQRLASAVREVLNALRR